MVMNFGISKISKRHPGFDRFLLIFSTLLITSDKGPGISKWYLGTRTTPENAMRFAILALLNIKIPQASRNFNQVIPWKTHAYAVFNMHLIDSGL